MFKIQEMQHLNPTIFKMVVEAPMVARSCQPGQFIIVRSDEEGERIPLTICDYDREKGSVTIVVQVIGAGTMDAILDAHFATTNLLLLISVMNLLHIKK